MLVEHEKSTMSYFDIYLFVVTTISRKYRLTFFKYAKY